MALTDNLVSYWKLDETSGDRADSHGSNTLIDNNTTPSGTGKIGNAADSNGSDDYLRANDHSSLDITGDITINFWFNSGTGTKTHFGKWEGSSNNSYLLQLFSDDLIYWVFSDTGSNTLYRVTNSTVSRSGWHMMTGTYVASTQTAKIYFDGAVAAGTNVGTLPTTIFSGSSGFTNRYFGSSFQYSQGLQDEVGLWSRALSDSEVAQLYNSGNGLAYPFTSNTHDASGKLSFTGLATVTGALSFSPVGQLFFNGLGVPRTSVLIQPAGQLFFNGLGAPRTSALIQPAGQLFFNGIASAVGTSSTFDGLITIGDGAADQSIVLANGTDNSPTLNGFGYYSSHGGGGNAHGSVGSMPSTGQYYHLTMTRDSNAIKFYVNGSLVDTVNLSGQTADYGSTPVVNIGRRISGYFNGRIDDVRVYSRALPQGNVTSLSQGDDLSNASFTIGVIGGSTGPLRFSGQATTSFTPNYNMTGTLFITGDADEAIFAGYFQEGSGLFRISGIATTLLNFYHEPIGRLLLSGLAKISGSVTHETTGKFIISGLAFIQTRTSVSPTGQLTLTGQGAFTTNYVYLASGLLRISGLGTPSSSVSVQTTGALFFTGLVSVAVSYVYLTSGQLRISGLSQTINSASISGLGALLLTGQGVFAATYVNYQPTGKIIFTGLARSFAGKETDGIGGFILSGQGVFAATYRYLASGQLRFSGDMGVSAVTYEASGVLLITGTVPLQEVYFFNGSGKLLLFEPTLLAWWRLNEGSGGLAGDSSGYNKTGTLFNMENADWVGGTPFLPANPYSLSFDGVEEYVGADFSHGEGITEFTISLWANTTTLPPAPGGMGMTMADFLLDALDAELFLLENEQEYTITFAAPKPQVND